MSSLTKENTTESQSYRDLASATSREHQGNIPKGSEAARAQSEHDKREAEAAQGRGYVGHVAARGVEQSAGETPPMALNLEVGGKPVDQVIPEDIRKHEQSKKDQQKSAAIDEMKQSPHLGVFES
eukprot:gene32285-39045_t